MKAEWREARLGTLVRSVMLGGTYAGQAEPTSITLVKMGAMARGSFVPTAFEYVSNSVETDPAHILRNGDLLLNTRNSLELVGKVAIWRGEAARAVFDNNVMRLEFDGSKILSADFANILMNSVPVIRQLRRRAIGTTSVAAMYWRDLKRMPVLLPPMQVQDKVVRIESAFRNHCNTIGGLLDARRAFKRGLMQLLLTGQKRFPEFRSLPWREVHLGDVFIERNESNRPDLPLLSVTGDRGVIPRDELVKRDTSNPDKSKYKRVAIGDIAYNTMRMWQGVSALSTLEGIISPAYTVAVPNRRIDGRFARHLFKFPPVIHVFHRHSQGLVDDTLNLKFDRFAKIKIRIPSSVEEQVRIASALDFCDSQTELLSNLQEQFEVKKRDLLSRLLSGEISVPA